MIDNLNDKGQALSSSQIRAKLKTAEQQVQHTASSCSGTSVCDLIF